MNKSEIKDQLNDLKVRFEDIFKLFDSPVLGLTEKENLKLISEHYSEIKDYINTYNTKLKKSKKLSDDDVNFLLPAINTIALHCTARKGSMNKTELSSSLYDGQDYCSYYISQIDV